MGLDVSAGSRFFLSLTDGYRCGSALLVNVIDGGFISLDNFHILFYFLLLVFLLSFIFSTDREIMMPAYKNSDLRHYNISQTLYISIDQLN